MLPPLASQIFTSEFSLSIKYDQEPYRAHCRILKLRKRPAVIITEMHRAFTVEIASSTGECFQSRWLDACTHRRVRTHIQFSCVVFLCTLIRRTNSDILELSEISLDLNLVNSNIRFKFTDSPILTVSLTEIDEHLIVLVATVSSIHQLKFSNPLRVHKANDETQSFSVFHEAATQASRDPSASLFYVIGHAATPRKYRIPFKSNRTSPDEFVCNLVFRSSDTSHGCLRFGRHWQRGILCARLPKQFDAVHDEWLQWTNNNGRTEGELHCAKDSIEFYGRSTVKNSSSNRLVIFFTFGFRYFSVAKTQRPTVNIRHRSCLASSMIRSTCTDCIETIISECGPHALANAYPSSIVYRLEM